RQAQATQQGGGCRVESQGGAVFVEGLATFAARQIEIAFEVVVIGGQTAGRTLGESGALAGCQPTDDFTRHGLGNIVLDRENVPVPAVQPSAPDVATRTLPDHLSPPP